MKTIQAQIIKKIEEYSTIIIHRHVKPDPDALGSQGGLKSLIQTAFPSKKVYAVGEETEGLKYIINMDKIPKDSYKNALVIVCDTANQERISHNEYLSLSDFVIKIDHHPDREPYGDISWVDTSFSSTCEMIMDLYLHHSEHLFLNDEGARLLFTGIIGDTGRFLYDNTKPRTMDYASKLMNYNFDPQKIYENFYKKTQITARLEGSILLNYHLTEQGVAYIHISRKTQEEFGVNEDQAANLVNTLKDIEGNKIWVFFVESTDKIRVRIRSAKTPINQVASQFNGGGHPLASGAIVYSWDEAHSLINELNKVCSI